MGKTLTISTEKAFMDYLSLGASRSLRQLHQLYAGSITNPPSLDTLKAWSKKENWQARLTEHQQRTRELLHDMAAQKAAEAHWNAAACLRSNAQILLETLSIKIPAAEVNSGADIRALAESAVTLLRTAEVLSGGVSERVEEIQQAITSEEARRRAEERVHEAFAKLAPQDTR